LYFFGVDKETWKSFSALIALVIALFLPGTSVYLTLVQLQHNLEQLQLLIEENPTIIAVVTLSGVH
jgi:hypothetical protein